MKTATKNYHPKLVKNLNDLTDRALDCFNIKNPLKNKNPTWDDLYKYGFTSKIKTIRKPSFEDFINEEKYSDEGIAFDEDGSLIE